jgi:hypothetical protein
MVSYLAAPGDRLCRESSHFGVTRPVRQFVTRSLAPTACYIKDAAIRSNA